MSKDDSLPLTEEYVASVDQWLQTTDLSGLPGRGEPVELPPPGAPVTVVRPVRLPFEIDALVKALADARGVSMSSLIREWITTGLAAAGQTPDPVSELRRGLDTAQRALDSLASRVRIAEQHRTAA